MHFDVVLSYFPIILSYPIFSYFPCIPQIELSLDQQYPLDLGPDYVSLKQYIINPDNLILGETLADGQFGRVKKAYIIDRTMAVEGDAKPHISSQPVVVKFLKSE